MNVEKRHVYDYEVDLTGQNAAVYVMQLVGQICAQSPQRMQSHSSIIIAAP